MPPEADQTAAAATGSTASDQSSSAASSQQQQGQAAAGSAAGSASNQATAGAETNQQQAAAGGSTAAPARPEGLPDSYWDATAGVKWADLLKDHGELTAFKAEQDSRRLTLPQSPDAYEPKLPDDFKVPDGVDFEIDPTDPLLAQFRKDAHALGLDQNQFSKLLGTYAAAEVGRAQMLQQAFAAEKQKLGPTATERVTAIKQWIGAKLGGDPAVAAIMPSIVTAEQVKVWEKVMSTFQSQGAGAFSQTGRDTAASKLSDDEYEKMSPSERLNYARSARAANG
ncbi:MAG: hypothetical protein IT562_10835 [Alphaproteobacteria bacterium]|nr:hypothetical protein [Alphaproteobacteria bacterium]